MDDICLNCKAPLGGPFCSQCGQARIRGPLRVRTWAAEVLDLVTSLETRLLRTFIGLSLRPGPTARRYIDGQRIHFTSPLKYAIVAASLWVLAFSLVNEPAQDESGIASVFLRYGQLANLASLPMLAVASWLAFRASGYSYAEQLCMAFYMGGHAFLWRAALALLSGLEGNAGVPIISPAVLNTADSLMFVVYSTWMLWGFHTGRVRFMVLRLIAAWFGIILASILVTIPLLLLAKLEAG